MCKLTVAPSSGYSVQAVAFNEQDETQGSELTVDSPQADKTYTCRVTQNGASDDTADTSVTLNVYGTYLLSLNRSGLGSIPSQGLDSTWLAVSFIRSPYVVSEMSWDRNKQPH